MVLGISQKIFNMFECHSIAGWLNITAVDIVACCKKRVSDSKLVKKNLPCLSILMKSASTNIILKKTTSMKILENTKGNPVWKWQILLWLEGEVTKSSLKSVLERVCTRFDWYYAFTVYRVWCWVALSWFFHNLLFYILAFLLSWFSTGLATGLNTITSISWYISIS